jgi:hypothetical protein
VAYINVAAALFGYDTWYLILREEHRLRVSEQGAEENTGSNRRVEKTAQ